MPTGAAKHRALEGCTDWPNRFLEMPTNKHCSGQTENVKTLSQTGKVPGIYFWSLLAHVHKLYCGSHVTISCSAHL